MHRGCLEEVSELKPGMDFRLPQYRREVFLRFYQFHLENRSHPGCVYYAMPWLVRKYSLTPEQTYWMAFLNGNAQNIVTTSIILRRFPDLPTDLGKLRTWFDENYGKLAWDTDRRYHKKEFIAAVASYTQHTGGAQVAYFQTQRDFTHLWASLRKFHSFGRLSCFSYAEYLRIIGLDVDCTDLFLEDMAGSKSHRNGLAKVLGRDDRDWHSSTSFEGNYGAGEISWLTAEAAALLQEARERLAGNAIVDPRHVSYYTLESAFCTYKSWHRKNRRYPNCYNDIFYERIKKAEQHWGDEVGEWWECRREWVPEHLLLEKCPNDPGLCPEKQNHYRETGEVVMMSRRWPEFDNAFDRRCWS